MQHFYMNPEFGENWFGYEKYYKHVITTAPDNSVIVEVGSWKGKSISYLGVEAINSGKTIKCFAVDTWLGSGVEAGHDSDQYVRSGTLYDLFLKNIEPIKHVVVPIRKTSLEASKMFADGSLHCVFIDANHKYECVKEDIQAWLPKIKPGGMLSGHDYGFDGGPVHDAVHELIGRNEIVVYPANCWVYYK